MVVSERKSGLKPVPNLPQEALLIRPYLQYLEGAISFEPADRQ